MVKGLKFERKTKNMKVNGYKGRNEDMVFKLNQTGLFIKDTG